MASDLQTTVQLLQATLDPEKHKQGIFMPAKQFRFQYTDSATAEALLRIEERKPGFSLLLLNIVAADHLPLSSRLSGALCLKNFIKFNWVVGIASNVFV